jgi:hypothetical protein
MVILIRNSTVWASSERRAGTNKLVNWVSPCPLPRQGDCGLPRTKYSYFVSLARSCIVLLDTTIGFVPRSLHQQGILASTMMQHMPLLPGGPGVVEGSSELDRPLKDADKDQASFFCEGGAHSASFAAASNESSASPIISATLQVSVIGH